MSGECIFCEIAAGRAPAEILDEDEHTIAFLDINPWARGHSLVIPRRHAKNLYDIDESDLEHAMVAAQRLAARLRKNLDCEAVTLLNSSESAAWQVVPHFHIHLIPRYADDRLTFPQPQRADREEVARIASELRG
jgi:histidine triad (HIT) family protein